ncbi:MAG: hypothetical protein OER97_03690 [Gammaproteobacteria bacterium]|nr:hypothetical protein [Gammaproteobacteria bacterium]
MNSNVLSKLGATAYVFWGLLHLKAAQMVWQMGHSLDAGPLQGRILQLSWDLLFFATVAIAVAVGKNLNNSRLGYWVNLIVVSAADIGFIVFVLVPGYVPIIPGVFGPLLWVIAVVFSTIAIKQADGETTTR